MRRLKTVRRPPIYPKSPGHLPCSSLTHPLPLPSRRPSVSFGGFGVRQIRDSTTLRPKKRKDAVRILETLRNHVSYSVDIAAVAAELATSRDAPSHFNFLAGQFEARPEGSSPGKSLGWYLTRGIQDRANWLLRTDRALRDQLTQYGSLLGTAENVRLQKTIGYLTWVLVVFGVATILMSGLALTQTPWFDDALVVRNL